MNFKTTKLVSSLFLMVLDLTTREFDATLHADKSLKIEAKLGELGQVHRVVYFSSRTGHKVFLDDDISYGAYFSAVLV